MKQIAAKQLFLLSRQLFVKQKAAQMKEMYDDKIEQFLKRK